MAFREVVPPKEVSGEFFQFKAIGDNLAGYFVGVDAAKGSEKYPAKPGDIDVHVLGKGANGPAIFTVSPAPKSLKRAVEFAIGNGTLVEGVEVRATFMSNLPIAGRDQPMKIIKLVTDIDNAGKPIVKAGVLAAIKKHGAEASAPKPPPKPKADDEIFGGDSSGPGNDDIPF